jgi:hypothetical protein
MAFSNRFLRIAGTLYLLAAAAAQAPKDSRQDVYTMYGEYQIVAQDDGAHYLLRRLSKDGSVFETVILTKISEKKGEITFQDAKGAKYVQLVDGRLMERIELRATPAPPPSLPVVTSNSVPMPTPSKVPVNTTPTRVSFLTLPKGQQSLRVEGGQFLLTIALDDNGTRHEVAVKNVAPGWYIRTSVSSDPAVAPVFRIDDDGTVVGLRELSPEAARISALNRVDRSLRLPPAQPSMPANTAALVGDRPITYNGQPGAIFTSFDGAREHTYLTLNGQPVPLEITPVNSNPDAFVLAGRSGVLIAVDVKGYLFVTGADGKPASLTEPPTNPIPVNVPPMVSITPPALPDSYQSPVEGTSSCGGSVIPQNGEAIIPGLPSGKLELQYDTKTWEGHLQPVDGKSQRLILRNKKPGPQKKCVVSWKRVA